MPYRDISEDRRKMQALVYHKPLEFGSPEWRNAFYSMEPDIRTCPNCGAPSQQTCCTYCKFALPTKH